MSGEGGNTLPNKKTMSLYIVLDSFVDTRLGVFEQYQVVELPDDMVAGLPVKRFHAEQLAEAASLNLENTETADARPVRKGRDHAHPTRIKPQ